MILVLEDMPERIHWLKQLTDEQIVHTDTVADFLAYLEDPKYDITLIILDHDLGGVPLDLEQGTLDDKGNTGMDAVYKMPKVSCPVLVWSLNIIRAPIMAETLRKTGVHAEWHMFRSGGCVQFICKHTNKPKVIRL